MSINKILINITEQNTQSRKRQSHSIMNYPTFLQRNEFRTLYGERIYAIAKTKEKLHQKKTKIDEHIMFLKECKNQKLIPNGLRLKIATNSIKSRDLIKKTNMKLLQNLINYRYKQQRIIQTEIVTQESILNVYLRQSQPERHHNQDFAWINKHDQSPKVKLRNKHERKIQRLKEELKQKTPPVNNNEYQKEPRTDTSNVINLSKTKLSNKHLDVLSKGLKFVPTTTSFDFVEMIANTEVSLYSAPTNIKKAAIAEISEFAIKWKRPRKTNITKEEQKLLKDIKNNNNIIVVVADKGNKTVIMDKDEYLKKVEDIIQDKKLYQEVNDPTAKIKKKINNLTTQLLKKRKITEAQKWMLNSNENLATIKAQPKIHKDGNPMRIITCTRSTILSNITSFVFSLIKHLQDTINNNLSNTDQFISNIRKIKLEKEDRLSSLDVKDLFNSVPTTKAFGIALKKIEQSEKFKQSNFNKTDIKELLNLCTTNSYFTFNNKYYKRIKGLPMGSTISPLLADLYMDDFINTHFIDIKHRMYMYVDDIFLITTLAKSDLDSFVTEINSKRTSIKFTCEYEQN